jgi:hypothetical protein
MTWKDEYEKALARYQEAKAKFEAEHPNYCRHCGGWGYIGSGLMDSDTGIPDIDLCPECSEQNKCPHCGGTVTPDGDEHCLVCGYTVGTDNGLPEPPDMSEFIPDPEPDKDMDGGWFHEPS